MNTEKTVTHTDVGGKNFKVLIRPLPPEGMPILMTVLFCVVPASANCLLHQKEIEANGELLYSLVQIHSFIAGFFLLALYVVYRWSRKSSYDKFCDWFYDESRKWSYAGLTVAVLLAVSIHLTQNVLDVDSVEEADQPIIIFSLLIPYASVMFIAWQVLLSLLFFIIYFRIDRSTDTTDSVEKGFLGPMFAFAVAPMLSAFITLLSKVDDFPKSFTNILLLIPLLASTISTFLIWAFISRVHAPRNTKEELRKSLRKYISRRWRMYRRLRCWCGHEQRQQCYMYLLPRCWCWAWDKEAPPCQKRNVGMFT